MFKPQNQTSRVLWLIAIAFLATSTQAHVQTDPSQIKPRKTNPSQPVPTASSQNQNANQSPSDPQANDQAEPAESSTSDTPPTPETPTTPAVDRQNPRALIRSFMVAVQESTDKPERIADAVTCLDTSAIQGEAKEPADDQRLHSLARRLHFVIDKLGLQLEDIPQDYDKPFYIFKSVSINEFTQLDIALKFNDEQGLWLFTHDTVATIPAMHEKLTAQAEQAQTPKDSDVPAARRTPRATMATFLEAMNADPPDIENAIACLDPAGQDPDSWDVSGKTLAVKLKNVMDKTKLVVLADIPESPTGNEYVWFSNPIGAIVVHRVTEKGDYPAAWTFAPTVGEWRFSPKTLKSLDKLYTDLEDHSLIKELQAAGKQEDLSFELRFARLWPKWFRETHLWIQGWQWVMLLALIPLGWLIQRLVSLLTAIPLNSWLKRKRIALEPPQKRSATRSIGAVAAVLFWRFVVQNIDLPPDWVSVLLRITQFAFAITAVWAGYRLVDIIGGYIAADKNIRLTEIDEVLVPLLRKILRTVVVALVIIFVLNWIGYSTTTILGALGIGGVAIAFASQDTLGNFFGSITVLFDRPFNIGDWIVVGDVEGSVERVGFRSTRVRTFYNSVVTIPNSNMVNTAVDNYGARRYRRLKTMISIAYGTRPDLIDAFCEGIRELIRLHPYTRKDSYHVYFNQLSASSLDILLYMFLDTPDWSTELRERHRLFNDIIRLADSLGVEFAFPTQTLHLTRAVKPDPNLDANAESPEHAGLQQASKLFEETYKGNAFLDPVIVEQNPRSQKTPDTN